tara:strand:+ start:1930 stop:2943 length:1014 start_codon:yes stop_codon:yes gene_type:complete
MNPKDYWRSQKSAYKEALQYVHNRKTGIITSFKTPWVKMNDAGVNGFEWHSLTVIAGRPGTGKTLIKDQIVREAFERNKGHALRILEFQFEMVAKASKVREFSSVLGKPYKYICSAYKDDMITEEDMQKLYDHSKKAVDIRSSPIDIVEKTTTPDEFGIIIQAYMEEHSTEVNGEKIYTNTVVTLDHSYLVKQGNLKSKTDMLYYLGEVVTKLKRAYPIAFIILSQLGRHVESPERNENGKYGNYILETDILGGDALFQHADIVIGLNRPANKFIEYYGPERFIIKDDTVLAAHFLKCRNGDTRMSFFEALFHRMEIQEMETPPTQQKRGGNVISTL